MRARWPCVLVALALPASAQAAERELALELACELAPAPGRVRCDLSIRPHAERVLVWVDALVVATPSFARPLRPRVAPRQRTSEARAVTLPFALVATGTGRGELRVRARAVLCTAALCRPASGEVNVELVVGQPP